MFCHGPDDAIRAGVGRVRNLLLASVLEWVLWRCAVHGKLLRPDLAIKHHTSSP